MPDDTFECEQCGAPLAPASADRICERCKASAPVTVAGGAGDGTDAESDAEPAVPSMSKHRILEEIGQGGMGTVHRARQDSLQRDVAVKIVNASFNYAGNLERFAREARVLALLDHPNIVPVYDYGTDPQGRRAYTMKLVRGRTLEAILTGLREGGEETSLLQMLRIFRKVCDAVGFAHSRRVIHRDLKPDNIMVGKFGEVLVMDWGLALDLSEGEDLRPSSAAPAPLPELASRKPGVRKDSSLTLEGEVLGTPQYMSPEQANGAVGIDARTDVYALGGILYAILTLRPPVPRGDFYETIVHVREGLIEPFDNIDAIELARPDLWRVPPPLLAVVRKAMAPDREKRFATVGQLAADVDAFLGGFATSAEKITLAGQLWLLVKRHRTFAISSLILLVISVIFVVRLIASEKRANDNEKIAMAEKAAAVAAEKLARQSAESARVALAHARTMQADSAYAADDTRQMRAALDEVPNDLRDAQWEYLNARTDDRAAVLRWNGDGFMVGSTPHPKKPGVFTVATNAKFHRIIDFDARTGEALKSFSYGEGWVRAIAYSPDLQRIAVGRIMGGGITIHDAKDGKELLSWKTDWVNRLQYVPDSEGNRLLRSRLNGCDLWDANTGQMLWQIPHGNIHMLLPGLERFVSIDELNIRIHLLADGSLVATLPIKRAMTQTASLSPDGGSIVVAHEDGRITRINLSDGSTVFEAPIGDDGDIRRTVFTPDGTRIITVAALDESGQSIQLLDAGTGRLLRRLRGGTGGVESMTVHPLSNDLLITCEGSATWALPKPRPVSWTLRAGVLGGFIGGNELVLAPSSSTPLAAISLSEGSSKWKSARTLGAIAATSFDGRVGVAQVLAIPKSGRDFSVMKADGSSIHEIASIRFDTDPRSMAVNCDGTRVAMGSPWGVLAAYQTGSGSSLPKIDYETIAFTNGLAWHGRDPEKLLGVFSRFGRRGNPDAQEWIVVWNTSTGKRIEEMRNPTALNCLATEPKGTRLAEGGDDKFVRIRDADSLAVLTSFRAHDSPIHAMVWNPALPILATSGTDRAIRLWDVETGRMIEEVHIGLREAGELRFSPDGRRLAASSPGAKTLVWEFPNLASDLAETRARKSRTK